MEPKHSFISMITGEVIDTSPDWWYNDATDGVSHDDLAAINCYRPATWEAFDVIEARTYVDVAGEPHRVALKVKTPAGVVWRGYTWLEGTNARGFPFIGVC